MSSGPGEGTYCTDTYTQTQKQTDRQTDRQTDTHTHTLSRIMSREREREREKKKKQRTLDWAGGSACDVRAAALRRLGAHAASGADTDTAVLHASSKRVGTGIQLALIVRPARGTLSSHEQGSGEKAQRRHGRAKQSTHTHTHTHTPMRSCARPEKKKKPSAAHHDGGAREDQCEEGL
jgi:hypothetical protein